MKKIHLLAPALLLLAMPLAVLAATDAGSGDQAANTNQAVTGSTPAGAGYEKIPGPWALGEFDHIKQVGSALWGKHKGNKGGAGQASSGTASGGQDPSATAGGSTGSEKIPGPWALGDFENVHQVGGALWGTPKAKPVVSGGLNAAGLTCFATALDTRDSAIIAAVTTQNSADQASMAARKDCLKTALNSGSSELFGQLKTCNQTYVDARKAAAKASQDAAQAARKQYVTDIKACAANNVDTTASAPDAGKVMNALEEPGEIQKPQPQTAEGGKAPEANPGKTGSGPKTNPAAVTACASLAKDAACSFADGSHTINGTCVMPSSSTTLTCRPAMTGASGGTRQPPAAAVTACASLAKDAACSFLDGTRTINGVCGTPPKSTTLVCHPVSPTGENSGTQPPSPPTPPTQPPAGDLGTNTNTSQ